MPWVRIPLLYINCVGLLRSIEFVWNLNNPKNTVMRKISKPSFELKNLYLSLKKYVLLKFMFHKIHYLTHKIYFIFVLLLWHFILQPRCDIVFHFLSNYAIHERWHYLCRFWHSFYWILHHSSYPSRSPSIMFTIWPIPKAPTATSLITYIRKCIPVECWALSSELQWAIRILSQWYPDKQTFEHFFYNTQNWLKPNYRVRSNIWIIK